MSLPPFATLCSPFGRKVTPLATEVRFPLLVLRTVALKVPVLSTFEALICIRRHPVQNIEIFAGCFLLRRRSHHDAVWSPRMMKYALLWVPVVWKP